ncbi:hypothetical protein PIB30_049788 [Stylosanthes scabra]|uniref:Uncharacterized protein n=1 Tax=Stylosanthes scabra TaxID=79078 RepID=A0ABU6QHA5_9FABA|nr:hypothetical protein [Stylosanthes scabra]
MTKSKKLKPMINMINPYSLQPSLTTKELRKRSLLSVKILAHACISSGNRERREGQIGGLIIPADFHVIKPAKKDNGGTPQVLLGRPFLKSGGFKLNYHDEIFTFEVGNTIKIFHFDDFPEPEKKGLHHLKNDKKKKKKKRMAKKRRKREEEEVDKKNWRLKIQTAKSKKDKKKKALSTLEKRKGIRKTEGSNPKKKKIEGEKIRRNRKKKREKAETENDEARIRCSSLSELFRKLKGLKRCLRQKKGADAHLVKNNSKWK